MALALAAGDVDSAPTGIPARLLSETGDPTACLHCDGPFPTTRCTVVRKYCSDHCRRRAYQLAHPDREHRSQRKYRRRLRTTGQTPWHKLTASAWVDAQLARTDGVPQRAIRCGHCRRDLAVLVDQRALVLSGRIVLDLAAEDGRHRLKIECGGCNVFRTVAQGSSLAPVLTAAIA